MIHPMKDALQLLFEEQRLLPKERNFYSVTEILIGFDSGITEFLVKETFGSIQDEISWIAIRTKDFAKFIDFTVKGNAVSNITSNFFIRRPRDYMTCN